jgi:predicted RNase H-like nuclease
MSRMIWRKQRGPSRSDSATVVGVDACSAGWIAVVLGQGAFAQAVVAAGFRELVAAVPSASIVAVDIPIGLPTNGWRRADMEARRFLGGRSSSVFATPPRAAVEASSYEEANRSCRALTGQGLSRQAWALAPKILEVDRCRSEMGASLFEIHPEALFRALAGRPLTAGKRTWAGYVERRSLLDAVGIVVPADIGPAGLRAAVDDVLDATAAAWSAKRIASGVGRSLPDPPERDAEGQPVAIWY